MCAIQGCRSCAKGLRRKVWTGTKILSPNICYFVVILRFVEIYALFGNLWAKKCFLFRSKTVFLRQEVYYYTVYISYYTDLDFQICKYAQKQRICRENSKYESIATVGEIRVYWRADFQSGSRVLKKVF